MVSGVAVVAGVLLPWLSVFLLFSTCATSAVGAAGAPAATFALDDAAAASGPPNAMSSSVERT